MTYRHTRIHRYRMAYPPIAETAWPQAVSDRRPTIAERDDPDRERQHIDVTALAARLRIVSGLILRHTRNDSALAGLTLTQISVLGRLERGGPMSSADLAQIERLRPQTIRNVVDGLRDRGLVVSERDSVDARRIRLALTEEGRGWVRGVRTTATDNFLTRALAEQLAPTEMATLAEALELLERVAFAPTDPHSTHRGTSSGLEGVPR
ncbi:MarR family winged helix-turn-helix transcriptional regulator [Nocardia abscessus]|uniref:MarR family winged helix-turn-helix transcriptional regulator n=1 Tax=Nocardia abscessus TaxID=120957 RepID=UPI00030E0972|nr:MarR family transcriptional regulator [Nocardia abscessus]MCC3332124.1 MarR family transcriptional regulator [Nocardia abscessus]